MHVEPTPSRTRAVMADGVSRPHALASARPEAFALEPGASDAAAAPLALPLETVQDAFDQLPGALLFVKDQHLRYIACNEPMAAFCGALNRRDVLGRNARAFFADTTWRQEEAVEGQVLRTARPHKNRLELRLRLNRTPAWSVFSYWPLLDGAAGARRIIGVGRVLARPDRRHATYQAIAKAIEELHRDFHASIDVTGLARRSGLSARQLDANFVDLFGVPPRRYLTKVRLEAATELLGQGASVAAVAHSCGYADQSAFTRRFRAATGMSPSQYRARMIKS